jgi:hypothetical protein
MMMPAMTVPKIATMMMMKRPRKHLFSIKKFCDEFRDSNEDSCVRTLIAPQHPRKLNT